MPHMKTEAAPSGGMLPRLEAARFLGMSPRTLDELTAERKITAYHITVQRKGYKVADLETYIAKLPEWGTE